MLTQRVITVHLNHLKCASQRGQVVDEATDEPTGGALWWRSDREASVGLKAFLDDCCQLGVLVASEKGEASLHLFLLEVDKLTIISVH